MKKLVVAVVAALALTANAAPQDTPTAPGKYSYSNFQRMPMPPETNERQCDVYSRAANQMIEMRRDGITYAVAFEDVNRIDVWNEKVVMIAMLGAAYSKEGRTAWRDPRSAEWSVMRKCTAWLYNNNQRETM